MSENDSSDTEENFTPPDILEAATNKWTSYRRNLEGITINVTKTLKYNITYFMRLDKVVYETAHNLVLKHSCDAIKKLASGSFF